MNVLVRLRQPASRADEVIALRDRLERERKAEITDEERRLAGVVADAKLAVSAALRDVSSCGSCAKGQPWPTGHHAGGACCAGVTAELFDPRELAALAHAGTRSRDLVPPPREDAHAGCAFRGSRGCTLAVAHRPARCIHYVCEGLRGELHRRGALDTVEGLLRALNEAMQAYGVEHRARVDREVLAPLVEALYAATARDR